VAWVQERSWAVGSFGVPFAGLCLMVGTGAIVVAASGHANALDADVVRLGGWLAGPLAGAAILDRQRGHAIGFVLSASGLIPILAVWARGGEIAASAGGTGDTLVELLAVVALAIGVILTAGLEGRKRRWLVALMLTTGFLAGTIGVVAAIVDGPLSEYLSSALQVSAVAGVATLMMRTDVPDVGFAFTRLALLTVATILLVLTYGFTLMSLSWTGLHNYPAAAAAATALMAVALLPVYAAARDRLAVWLYGLGQRPDLVLAMLSHSLDTAGEAEDTMGAACDAVAEAVRSPGAWVALGESEPAAPPGASTVLLQAGGRFVGTLVVAPRRPNESFSRRDVDLITTMAAPLAQVARATGLAAALEVARRELEVQRLDERRRLRRDLHDGLGPLLAGLGLRLDALERGSSVELQRKVADLKDAVATSRREVRRIVDGLAPEGTKELVDLEQSLTELVQGWSSATAPLGMQFEIDFIQPIPRLTEPTRIAVYRIAGEAITNVVRHARATTCSVRLRGTDETGVTLEIRDNGVGLRPGTGGFGLRSMQERATAVGGSLETSVPDNGGTVVRLELPPLSVEITR
jgi:signal transduction histidine kinase